MRPGRHRHPSRARLSRADATGDSTQLGRLAKEAREDGVLYALVAGQWYEVRASFADEVIEFAERLPELDLPT